MSCAMRHHGFPSTFEQAGWTKDSQFMHIEIVGDDSISRQARTYAEYRLFAALSQVLDGRQIRNASLVLRRAKNGRYRDGVVCTATVKLHGGDVTRVRTYGHHPYAAINRAVERLRLNSWPVRDEPSNVRSSECA